MSTKFFTNDSENTLIKKFEDVLDVYFNLQF
jgi:hypothetical protein